MQAVMEARLRRQNWFCPVVCVSAVSLNNLFLLDCGKSRIKDFGKIGKIRFFEFGPIANIT